MPSGLTWLDPRVSDKLFFLRIGRDHRLPDGLECFHLGVDMLELGEAGQGSGGAAVGIARRGVAVGVVGTFAGLAVGLQTEVETLQQPADQLLTGDEAPLGQRRGEMALAQADPPQRSLGITADRRLRQFIQSLQDPGRRLDRGLLSATPATNPLAAPHRPGPEVRQAAAYGAAGNSGGPRNRGNAAVAGSACFTGREQASVSFIEEQSECIVAGPDGVMVDHPPRLNAKASDSPPLFRIRSLRSCRFVESFLPSRLFWLRPQLNAP